MSKWATEIICSKVDRSLKHIKKTENDDLRDCSIIRKSRDCFPLEVTRFHSGQDSSYVRVQCRTLSPSHCSKGHAHVVFEQFSGTKFSMAAGDKEKCRFSCWRGGVLDSFKEQMVLEMHENCCTM